MPETSKEESYVTEAWTYGRGGELTKRDLAFLAILTALVYALAGIATAIRQRT